MKIPPKILFLFIVGFCMLVNACQSVIQDSNTPADATTKANAQIELGLAYLDQNDSSMAKEKLLKALQESPDWPPAQDAMAYYLEKTGDTKSAELYYQKAISSGVTNNGAAFNNYGAFLCRMKRPMEADHMFLKAVSDSNYLNTASAYQNAGYCMLSSSDKNRLQKANVYFEKAKVISLGNKGKKLW